MKKILDALMKGFSYYLPVIVVAAILTQLSNLFLTHPEMVEFFSFSGYLTYRVAYVVLAAFIAFALGDRLALLPGLVGGYIVMLNDLGFISAVIVGLLSGYFIIGLKMLIKKSPRILQQTLMIVYIPLMSVLAIYGVTLILELFMVNFTNYYESFFVNLNQYALSAVCAILAMLMAYDLGGRVNKLAYIFAISTIGLGVENALIPAVMFGGMVPPMAIGLFHILFRNRRVLEKDRSGLQTFILGAFFISEAALPFYQSYKKQVKSAALVGSLVAGLLIGIANVSSNVVHGGILMFWTTSDMLMYFAALFSGIFTTIIIMIFTIKINNSNEI